MAHLRQPQRNNFDRASDTGGVHGRIAFQESSHRFIDEDLNSVRLGHGLLRPSSAMAQHDIPHFSESPRATEASCESIAHYNPAASEKSRAHRVNVPVKYVKIEASTYLICNNKLRCFLETELKTMKLLFHKEGPKMKFFKNAVGVLKNSLPSSDMLPMMLKFEKHKIRVSECDEETFQEFLVESDRKVFIKGISQNTSESQLRSYLEYFGHVQYLQVTPNRLKNSSFCAVAIFASHQSMLAVLECKTHYLNGRRIDIDRYINNTFKKGLDTEANQGTSIQKNITKEPKMPKINGAMITPTVVPSKNIANSLSHQSHQKLVNISQVAALSQDDNYRYNISASRFILTP